MTQRDRLHPRVDQGYLRDVAEDLLRVRGERGRAGQVVVLPVGGGPAPRTPSFGGSLYTPFRRYTARRAAPKPHRAASASQCRDHLSGGSRTHGTARRRARPPSERWFLMIPRFTPRLTRPVPILAFLALGILLAPIATPALGPRTP